MTRLGALLVILALAVPAVAEETEDSEQDGFFSDFRLFGTTNTFFEDNQTVEPSGEERDYRKLKQLVSVNAMWSKFSAGIDLEYLDYSVDADEVQSGDLDRLHDDVEARKYYLEYLGNRFSLRLGTFFTSFGHGMSLYVQKNEQLGLDEPVHGATATVNLGPVELTALGGRVTDPLLEVTRNREFEDEIVGGRVVARLPHDVYVGGSYVEAEMDSEFLAGTHDTVDVYTFEAGGYSLAGFLDAHAEWAEMERTERGRNEDGYGRYLSLSSTFGPLTILVEGKDYWNFQYRYNLAPNAGRAVETYDHNDVKGARLRLDGYIAASGTLVFASYGEFDTHRRPSSFGGDGGDGQVEWFLGVEESVGRLYAEASYFNRDWTERHIREEHVIADSHLRTGDRGDISLGYDLRLESSSYFRLGTHRSHLGYSWAPYGSIGMRYSWVEKSGFDDTVYWGGEVEYHPISAITVSLFVGEDPGGLVCSGGQCREEPPFEGLRARFTWRF